MGKKIFTIFTLENFALSNPVALARLILFSPPLIYVWKLSDTDNRMYTLRFLLSTHPIALLGLDNSYQIDPSILLFSSRLINLILF